MADTITEKLSLTLPEQGASGWLAKFNNNFQSIDNRAATEDDLHNTQDTKINNVQSMVDDVPGIYLISSTFNGPGGRAIDFTDNGLQDVTSTDDYVVEITPKGTTTTLVNHWVVKATTGFTVYCSGADTTTAFDAVVTYLTNHNNYGTAVRRVWYVNPDTAITDHGNTATTGSFANLSNYLLTNTTYGTIIFPSNGTYQFKTAHTTSKYVHVQVSPGGLIDNSYSIRSAAYKWTKNGATDEYYLELAAGGDPGLTLPTSVWENGTELTKMLASGALNAGEWAWDLCGGGFSTVYVRLSDSADPDGKAAGFVEASVLVDFASFSAPPNFCIQGQPYDYRLRAAACYAEWFGTDGINDAPAIEDCLQACHRLDGLSQKTYVLTSSVNIPSFCEIDFHNADVQGDAGLADYMFKVYGVGTAGSIPTSPVQNVTFKNADIDPKGATGFMYILASYFISIENVRYMNSTAATSTGILIRNSFLVRIVNTNINNYFGTDTIGVKVSSTQTYQGYFSVNNIGLYDSNFNRSTYNVYLDFNENGNGISSNTFTMQNCAIQCDTVAGAHWGNGVYFRSGSLFNALFSNNKQEYGINGYYIHSDVTNYHLEIFGQNFSGTFYCFDFNPVSGSNSIGRVDMSQIRYTSGAAMPVGDYYVIYNNNTEINVTGYGFSYSDPGSHYSLHDVWAGNGVGTLRRSAEIYLNVTTNRTIQNHEDHILIDNDGAAGALTRTLPSLAIVNPGFRVAVMASEHLKDLSVIPFAGDRILKYTLGATAGVYPRLYTNTRGSVLRLIAQADGWAVDGTPTGWRDYDGSTVLMSYSSVGGISKTGDGDLYSVTIPANTFGKTSVMTIFFAGEKSGSGNTHGKDLLFYFGASYFPLFSVAQDAVDWNGFVKIMCITQTSQALSIHGSNYIAGDSGVYMASPATQYNFQMTAGEDITTDIIIKLVNDNFEDVSDTTTLKMWHMKWE